MYILDWNTHDTHTDTYGRALARWFLFCFIIVPRSQEPIAIGVERRARYKESHCMRSVRCVFVTMATHELNFKTELAGLVCDDHSVHTVRKTLIQHKRARATRTKEKGRER